MINDEVVKTHPRCGRHRVDRRPDVSVFRNLRLVVVGGKSQVSAITLNCDVNGCCGGTNRDAKVGGLNLYLFGYDGRIFDWLLKFLFSI